MKKIVVTKIINKYQILLNIGKKDGITENSKFEIVGKISEIKDPITNESLGELTYRKVKLKVVRLLPKMCICEDDANRVQNAYISKVLENTMFKSEIVKHELNFDIDDFVSEQLDKSIYIGDEVILLEEEPEDDGNDTNDNEQNTND